MNKERGTPGRLRFLVLSFLLFLLCLLCLLFFLFFLLFLSFLLLFLAQRFKACPAPLR